MKNYHRLAHAERYQIEALVNSGLGVREIARQLNRSPSSICREVRRLAGSYRAEVAEEQSQVLRKRPRFDLRKIRGSLKTYVHDKLNLDWSPEQISGRLRCENEDVGVSHQTIYRYLKREKEFGGVLWRHLRILRKQRKDKFPRWKPTRLEGRTLIADRPAIVEKRQRVGDFERDTVEGKRGRSLLLTAVDRTSRFSKIAWIEKKCSYLTHEKTVQCLKDEFVRSITNDNGTEFSQHQSTADQLGTKIYFSRAYRAWERGTNENFNGLLRQYFPKKKDIGVVSEEEIQRIEDLLNNRPRKYLGYKTPKEVHQHLKRQLLR